MAFPQTQAPVTIEIAPGADLTAAVGTWTWVDITSYVRTEEGIDIDYGRRDEGEQVDTTNCSLTLDNSDGRFSPRNPLGTWYGDLRRNTPLRIKWDTNVRFVGYVTEWPPRWDLSENNATVPIQATGILRRLQQGSKAFQSPLYRAITAANPVAYWPLEDPEDTAQAFTPVQGGFAMEATGFTWANTEQAGSKSLPELGEGASYSGQVASYTGTEWRVEFMVYMESASGLNRVLSVRTTNTAVPTWDVIISSSNVTLRGVDGAGSSVFTKDLSATVFFGSWNRIVITAEEGALSTTDYTFKWIPEGLVSGTSGTGSVAKPPGIVQRVLLPARASEQPVSLGHIAVFDDITTNVFEDTDSAYYLEPALDRMIRLCEEENVPFSYTADPDDTSLMGLQGDGSLTDLLRECEIADGGILYEKDGGLAYRARTELYNQDVTLELTKTSGHLAEPPEPTDDDLNLLNDVTAARKDGTKARWVDESSVAAIGEYSAEIETNLGQDSDLLNFAAWAVHLGTVDEMRWPVISLAFERSSSLLTSWLALPIGGRLTIDHGLTQLPGVEVDLLAQGWAEHIEPYSYRVSINASPASSWSVAVVGSNKLDTAGCELTSSVTSTQTTLPVTTTAGPSWTTDPAEYPFDLKLGGEEVRATGVSGSGAAQTLTVTRSINGITKAHAAGTAVSLASPLVIGR